MSRAERVRAGGDQLPERGLRLHAFRMERSGVSTGRAVGRTFYRQTVPEALRFLFAARGAAITPKFSSRYLLICCIMEKHRDFLRTFIMT